MSFNQLYEQFRKRIERDAVRLARGERDFEDDLMQEGFLSLLETSLSGKVELFPYQSALRSMLKERRREYAARLYLCVGGPDY